jgi:hypothetical protein
LIVAPRQSGVAIAIDSDNHASTARSGHSS